MTKKEKILRKYQNSLSGKTKHCKDFYNLELRIANFDDTVVFYNEKILTIKGRKLVSRSGKEFRAAFSSEKAINYAMAVQKLSGWLVVGGKLLPDDNLYIGTIRPYSPIKKGTSYVRLLRLRDTKENEAFLSAGQCFTGQHRSHERGNSVVGNLHRIRKKGVSSARDAEKSFLNKAKQIQRVTNKDKEPIKNN